ncbi:hypothetical protein B0H10DRAFT_1172530 [Mycena sp. CBHHK59/15]|nr:hypothetical protein B0H10DRAFT_1172530 [Mycena sp. CBHHK59/15]
MPRFTSSDHYNPRRPLFTIGPTVRNHSPPASIPPFLDTLRLALPRPTRASVRTSSPTPLYPPFQCRALVGIHGLDFGLGPREIRIIRLRISKLWQ